MRRPNRGPWSYLGRLAPVVVMVAGLAEAVAADTLYELYAPSGTPGPGPRDAGSLWRVWVTYGPNGARCADGTTPVLYVRAAPPGSAHADDQVALFLANRVHLLRNTTIRYLNRNRLPAVCN